MATAIKVKPGIACAFGRSKRTVTTLDFASPGFVEQDIAKHEAKPDPHPQYTSDAEALAIARGEVVLHEAKPDPHPQYALDTKGAFVAVEALSAGDFVYVVEANGVRSTGKASALPHQRLADGFVLQSCAAGETATVHFDGVNDQCDGGLLIGRVYLSVTPGKCSSEPPQNPGEVVQRIGVALSDNRVLFRPTGNPHILGN